MLNNGFAVGPKGEPLVANNRTKFDGESLIFSRKSESKKPAIGGFF